MHPPACSVELTQVAEWRDGAVHLLQDSLAAEEPLEIRIDGAPVTVTMRTPGHDVELNVTGLLNRALDLPHTPLIYEVTLVHCGVLLLPYVYLSVQAHSSIPEEVLQRCYVGIL